MGDHTPEELEQMARNAGLTPGDYRVIDGRLFRLQDSASTPGELWADVVSYHHALVEECCAGAEVRELRPTSDGETVYRYPPIPLAHVGSCAGLAEPVAVELAGRPITWIDATMPPTTDPPFAAAVIEAGGVRKYVLASGACPCDGCSRGQHFGDDGHVSWVCDACSGTGARTNCKTIADKYQPNRPWRDDDTPRLARFTTKT